MERIDYDRMKWVDQVRTAYRQLNLKVENNGHYPKHNDWTYKAFREFFTSHYERGIKELEVHKLGGEFPYLLHICRVGMCVPDWNTVSTILE